MRDVFGARQSKESAGEAMMAAFRTNASPLVEAAKRNDEAHQEQQVIHTAEDVLDAGEHKGPGRLPPVRIEGDAAPCCGELEGAHATVGQQVAHVERKEISLDDGLALMTELVQVLESDPGRRELLLKQWRDEKQGATPAQRP